MSEKIRREIQTEEFDYQSLMDSLKAYARPRDKITGLLRRGDIIRVKKPSELCGRQTCIYFTEGGCIFPLIA